MRIRVQAGDDEPEVDSLFALYPGSEAMEREAFDMFGILFRGHPDLTRILMPEDWEGHPLRKDYGDRQGARAVQGSAGSPVSDPTVRIAERVELLTAETSEGAQELKRRAETRTDELGREVGAVLRVQGLNIDPDAVDFDRRDDETMIINMGPSHPSTHGVLRLMLELDGEFVLRTKPVIGYLHTGMEKTGEELSYIQGGTNVTRMDYLSPVINELSYSMAVETAARHRGARARGVDPHADERAQPHLVAPRVDGDQRHGPRVDAR